MKIRNPATGAVFAELAESHRENVIEQLKKLREGQAIWASLPLSERIGHILRFGELILENTNELAKLLTTETGKPIQQSINEIRGAHNRIEHISANADRWLKEETVTTTGGTHEKIRYEPLGVVANISAWNFPYNVGYNVFLYALVAGNAVLYKPSEYASLTGKQFEKYLHRAGVPENVFTCAIGGGELGKLLLELDFDGYFFTGSFATGQSIARAVAHKLVPVQLELGGKDPLYVCDDVPDVRQAAINAAEGAFYNNGQSCCAVERIYVHHAIYDTFVRALTEEVENYRIGDPMDPETFLGPLTRRAQIDLLEKQVADAVERGAVLQTGGQGIDGPGYYFEPTVLVNCDHTMRIMKEESFGPVIGIQKVKSDQEAIALMQDTEYGLTAAVFSASEQRAMDVLEQMKTGTVYWNCCDRVSPNLPWSGRKNSGLGSTLAAQGIRAFVQPKSYHLRKP